MSEQNSTFPTPAEASRQIIDLLDAMYDAYQNRDWGRFNANLDPAVTAWESHLPDLIAGQNALDAHRASRPAPRPLASLTTSDHLVDAWDGTALVRYQLVAVDLETGFTVNSRVTEALRWNGARWHIVHRHAEYLPTPTH